MPVNVACFIVALLGLPQSHHVLLLGLVHNTYFNDLIQHNVHIIIKSNAEKVIRIVALTDIDSFVDEGILGLAVFIVVFLIVVLTRRTLVSTTFFVVELPVERVLIIIAAASTA